ncbi:hypothetical protein CkaCkLH20_11404 [Colletotrichum karsti]|uniref:Ubiquitin-like protease family profile domain-containing protein n=1 Tax=Colletotrichum karsti TaxID=1095194 RepID=A0A9P6HU07_9PEZI|nr:uncharacterized protein CkaCkLH20_11404 [Colletotrichum karsti]KAF9870987.1 hypothetical protein CkaCkLH20_11404 [Colletotrichum karsti]
MPATRKSQGAAQPDGSAINDTASVRTRKEIEVLCRKWGVPVAQLTDFFGGRGTDVFTPKFLSCLRDLRVRTSWSLAKTLLQRSRTKTGTWQVQDVKGAIVLAEMDRDSNAHIATRSSRSSGLQPAYASYLSLQTPQTPSETLDKVDNVKDIYEMPDDLDDTRTLSRRRASTRYRVSNIGPPSTKKEDNVGQAEQEAGASSSMEETLVDSPATTAKPQSASKSRLKRSIEDNDYEYPAPKRSAATTKYGRTTRRSLNKQPSPVLDSSPLSSVHSKDVAPEEIPESDVEVPAPQNGVKEGKHSAEWPRSFAHTLGPGEWLNDDAIYVLLTTFASCAIVKGRHRTAVVEPLLVTSTRKTPVRSLKTLLLDNPPDFLILPVHLQNHWVLIVVRLSDYRAELLDSMPSKSNRVKAGQIYNRFASLYLPEGPDSVLVEVPSAEQDNDYDCGVFTIVNAIHALIGRPPPMTISADPWRKVFMLLSDAGTPDSQTFAEYLELPTLDDVPTTQHTEGRDIDVFHELRKTWSSHFEKRIAYLSGRIGQIKELEDIGTILETLIKPPADLEATSPDLDASNDHDVEPESEVEKELRNCERQLELRIELSHLPGCEFESDNLAPLREKVARLKSKVGGVQSRKEARQRLLSVIEVLETFKEDAKVPFATLGGWLAEYRDLYIGTTAAAAEG